MNTTQDGAMDRGKY